MATSLAGLWAGRNKTSDAAGLLAPLLERFGQDEATLDVRSARKLFRQFGEGGG